ncbi:MAG: O-antigen ligase family protein [Proteobacteria bacterium]|nr:O-antigen ligase family protein [Pseudomonadota bacterium]
MTVWFAVMQIAHTYFYRHFPAFSQVIAIPALLMALGFGIFFHGTQDILYAPCIFAVLIAGGAMLADACGRGFSFPRTATAGFMLAYWVYLLIALSWSTAPYISFFFFLIFSIPPFLFFAFSVHPCAAEKTRVYEIAILAALAVLAVWAIVQFFFLFDDYGARIKHPFFDPNSMAAMMNMGLFPAAALYLRERGRRRSCLFFCLTLVFYAGLLVTQSRGGMLGMGVSMLVLLVLSARPLKERGWKIAALCALLFVLPFLIQMYGLAVHDRGIAKSFGAGLVADTTDRVALWKASWQMIRDHFWTGTGLASFTYHYGAYRMPVDRSDGYFAHMDPLQFWVEMGVAAPVLFYAVLTSILFRTVRAANLMRGDHDARIRILGLFCAMLALVLHTHLTFHLYMPAILVPLSVLLFCWYGLTEKSVGGDARFMISSQKAKRAFMAASLFLIAVAGAWSVRASMGSYYIGRAATDIYTGALDKARDNLDRATFWTVGSRPQTPQYEALWRREKLRTQGKAMNMQEKSVLYGEALSFADEALRRQPSYVQMRNDKALLYFMGYPELESGGLDKAERELLLLLEEDGLSIDARLGLASIYRRKGELKKAADILEDGMIWPRPRGQPDINYLVMLANLKLQMGDRIAHDVLIAEARRRASHYGLLFNRVE